MPEAAVPIRRSVSLGAITSPSPPSSAGSDQDGASAGYWIPSSLSSQTDDNWIGDYRDRQHDRSERVGRSSRSGSAYSGSSGEYRQSGTGLLQALNSMPSLPGRGPGVRMGIPRHPSAPCRRQRGQIPTAWGDPTYPRSSSPPQFGGGLDEGPSNEAGILAMKIFAEVNGTVPIQQLQELAASGLLENVPRAENGELASVGSIYHHTGACAPCTYWFKSSCKYSIGCRYCHAALEAD